MSYNSPGRYEGETHGSDAIAQEVLEDVDEVVEERCGANFCLRIRTRGFSRTSVCQMCPLTVGCSQKVTRLNTGKTLEEHELFL